MYIFDNSVIDIAETLILERMYLIKSIFIAALIIIGIKSINAQNSVPLIQSIKSHNEGIGLWWAGHNGWIIKYDTLVIATDILLDYDKRALPSSISKNELADILDISIVTHGHKDHFNRETSAYLAKNSTCQFVLPSSCLQIAEELGIEKKRITIAEPRKPFSIRGIEIEPIRAIHGNANFAIYYDANLEDCGYVINIGGKRMLQPGDSHLLEDHLFLKDIDVLFFSPTEHNMYIDPSVILINKLVPEYILPQHRNTVIINESTRFWAKAYIEEVKLRLTQQLQDRYYILNQGDKILIE